ncbi:MAG: HAD family phosphatase [Nesterenkonia sp.]|nr:HAD family phosphatase [Nesterenkonia sp.]
MIGRTNSALTTVVFDLGNVLVGWDPYLPFADHLTRAEWREAADAAGFAALNVRADAGERIHDLVDEATRRDPAHGRLLRDYFDGFADSLTGPVPGTASIVARLRESGVRLLGLTNASAETYPLMRAAAPATDELEQIVVSGREGLIKPDAEIFRRLTEITGATPQESVFIDDTEANVRSASASGFAAIRFRDAEQLAADLRELGLLR